MAFCKYCGKSLGEGEICNCAGSMAAANGSAQAQQPNGQYVNPAQNNMNMNGQQPYAQQPNGQFNAEQVQQRANEYMQQGMEVANNAWKNLLGIFKAPAQAGRQYVAKADMVVSIVLIALQAVIAGLFGLICISRVNAAFSSVTSLFSSSAYKFSGAKGFFITLLFSLIFSAIFALIFFVAGKIVKADIDINKALAITSVRSAAVIPFMLAACILIFINATLGFGVFYLGNILAICFVYAAMTGICEENKLSYVVAAAMLVFLIVAIFIMSKAVTLYIPSNLKSLSGLSSLMKLLY